MMCARAQDNLNDPEPCCIVKTLKNLSFFRLTDYFRCFGIINLIINRSFLSR